MNQKKMTILKAGLLTGTLDILAACIFVFIKTGSPHFFDILKFIASGVFGKAAAAGGTTMILAGLILHYFVAFMFTIFFFWIFKTIKPVSKNKIISAVLYGVFIWAIMNLIVVPLSNAAQRPLTLTGSLINAGILIFCFGVPLSILANSSYKRR